MKRNMSKTGKRLCSLLLILVMVMVLIPSSLWAEEGEEKESQATSEIESESEVESETETSAQTESKSSESTESTESAQSDEYQPQAGTGSISGTVWLDENEDGVYDSGEKLVADYEVSLYLSSNTNDTVASVTTDSSGNYMFTDLAPDDYVVGIPLSQEVDGTKYLVPLIGISGDNKFALDETTYDAYTNTISIEPDSEMKDYSAGVRLPAGIQTKIVGIQEGGPYTLGSIIGFGGYRWYVIGGSTVNSAVSSSSTTLTLWLSGNFFGTTEFNPFSNRVNNYNGSTLQTAMSTAYDTLSAQEKSYVLTRSLDLTAYAYTSDTAASSAGNIWGYATPTNQSFWPLSRAEWAIVGAGMRSFPVSYWLRSPSSAYSYVAWVGYGTGSGSGINGGSLSNIDKNGIRPAFYLNVSEVIFTSDTSGTYPKTNASLGSATLQDASVWNPNASTRPIKLTMQDNTNLKLTSTTTSLVSTTSGSTVSIAYADAVRGTNNSVSVMLLDSSGNIRYYGRPVDLSGSGTASGMASVTIPSGLTAGSYTLKIFNEQVNSDNYTDYASTPVDIPLTIFSVTPEAVTSSATNITSTTATLNGTYNTGGVSGSVYFQYGSTASMTSTTTQTTLTSSTATSRSVAISGLTANTTYYYRMVIYVSGLYYYGNTLNFTTPPSITSLTGTPTGTTTADITAVFAAGLNNVYPAAVSISYNDTNSTTGAASVSVGSGSAYASGYTNYSLTGLNPNTTYYLWTSETTAGGTVTYPNATTSTISVLTYPDFTTWDVSVTTVSGSYYTGGSITAATVVYGTDPTLSSGSEITLTGDKTTISTGDFVYTDSGFTCDLTGLTSGTTYYVKTTVTNASGTTTSTIKPFSPPYTTDLAIDKTVTGSYGDPNQEFEVTITLMNSGTPVSGTYNYTSTDSSGMPTTGTVTFNAFGQGTIELKHGQTITIEGIPQGYIYTVEETDTAVTSGIYSVTYSSTTGTATSSEVTGTLGSTAADASIINDRSSVVVSGLSGTGYRIIAVSILVVLAVVVTTLWCYRRRKKCE